MDDPGRMGLHHWAGYDSSHLKDCLKDHPAMKLMDMVAERDSAVAERDTAMAEKKTAFAERDAALLQRDVAYADRNAAWMERDAALTALAMVRSGKDNNEAAAKLMQMVNLGGVPLPVLDSNSQDAPKAINGSGKSQGKKTTPKKRKSTAAAGQTNKESKPPSKRNRKQKASMDAVNEVEKHMQDGGLNKVSDALVPFFPTVTPIPYCSCTGSNQQCYRWGKGGWQSACCTNFLSMYPLPMNPSKRSSRVPGRKMSGGAFKKLLERLLSEGVDISASVDLKNYWAKHGTNRYVTIK
eukprot:c7506_g1_i1 orf=203-1090(+)